MNSCKTPAGTELPLIKLKGKDYLQVAHRLIWFNEVAVKFSIETSFPVLEAELTVAHAKVTMYDQNGLLVKSATATKRETKKDFPDHTEKAETGAIGRALAELGFGTQFALADLDEGDRIVDAPVVNVKEMTKTPVQSLPIPLVEKKAPSFKKTAVMPSEDMVISETKVEKKEKQEPTGLNW